MSRITKSVDDLAIQAYRQPSDVRKGRPLGGDGGQTKLSLEDLLTVAVCSAPLRYQAPDLHSHRPGIRFQFVLPKPQNPPPRLHQL